MEEGYQISPEKIFGIQGSPDTSSQMFGMMDELGTNFESEFNSAKARQQKQAKVTKKDEPEGEESAAAEEGEATEEGIEVALPTDGEEVITAEASEEAVTPEVEEVPVEAATLVEEVVVEEAPIEDGAELDTVVQDEPEVAVVEAEKTQEAPEVGAVESEAPVIEDVADTAPDKPPAPIADAAPIEAPAEAAATEETEVAEEVPVQKEKAPAPKVATDPKPERKPAAVSEAAAKVKEPEVNQVREDFHSLETKETQVAKVIQLDSKEAERILQGLQEIAEKSQIQNPNASTVSPRLLEGLKTNNAQLARQIESLRAPLESPGGFNPKPGATKSIQASRPADRPYRNPRMEELKEKVMEQVKFQMKLAIRNKAGTIQMKLKPHLLGNVKIDLTVENAQVTAAFVVETQSAKELLQKSSGQLQDMLREQGLEVDQVDVSVADHGENGSESGKAFASVEDQKAAREYLASFANLTGGSEKEVADSDTDEAADPDQILNIMA